jgi:tetratricopeptide (TPR) repeat protein
MRRFVPLTSLLFFSLTAGAQSTGPAHPKPSAAAGASVEHAVSLAEAGHCTEALPVLAKAAPHIADKDLQKRAGVNGVRCASVLGEHGALLDLLRMLSTRFPHDPEVLYLTVHAYSDLSTAAARELADTAPHSIPALEMDAEANEMQGKWDEAEKDYRNILEKDSRYPGIHFRLARLLLSRPNPPSGFEEEAKKELNQELAIDPTNAGAEYVLGEIARHGEDYPEAIKHFTRATQLNPTFGDAFLGLGMSLLADKKYADAVAPLESAIKIEPGNPAAHYGLATAYARTGRKEDAQREFALQQQLAARAGGPEAQPQQ